MQNLIICLSKPLRQNSKEFLMNQDFEDVHAKNPEGHDVLVWAPK